MRFPHSDSSPARGRSVCSTTKRLARLSVSHGTAPLRSPRSLVALATSCPHLSSSTFVDRPPPKTGLLQPAASCTAFIARHSTLASAVHSEVALDVRLHCLVAPHRRLCPFPAAKHWLPRAASAFASALAARRKRLQNQRQPTTMNVLLSPQPPVFPHQHENPRLSPSRSRKLFPAIYFFPPWPGVLRFCWIRLQRQSGVDDAANA